MVDLTGHSVVLPGVRPDLAHLNFDQSNANDGEPHAVAGPVARDLDALFADQPKELVAGPPPRCTQHGGKIIDYNGRKLWRWTSHVGPDIAFDTMDELRVNLG